MRRDCTVELCLSPSVASAVGTLLHREVIVHPLNELLVLYGPKLAEEATERRSSPRRRSHVSRRRSGAWATASSSSPSPASTR
jgi:hypothetical protein